MVPEPTSTPHRSGGRAGESTQELSAESAAKSAAKSTGELTGVRRIGRRALGWRLVVSVVGIVLLVNGSLRMTDDVWPFGPMSQYAFVEKPGDVVVVTRVDAVLADGVRTELPLTAGQTGISRAEIEAQIPAIEKDPALLSAVVDGWHVHHPTGPQPVLVRLYQDRTILTEHGPEPGRPEVLAQWKVPQ